MWLYLNVGRNEHKYAMAVKDEASEALRKSNYQNSVHSTNKANGQIPTEDKKNPYLITDNV